MTRADRADSYQREHSWLGFPIAVVYKVFEDRTPHLAAMVTYYVFVSLFPLLLLFTSAAGFLLQGNPHLRHQLIDSAVSAIPGLGSQLVKNIQGFRGSATGVAVGLAGTLYGALGGMQALQAAFNQIYGVPRHEQPNPLIARLRSLGLLVLLGTAVIVATGIAALVSTANSVSSQFGTGLQVVGYGVSFVINIALFSAAVQLLTARELRLRNVITGAAFAGGLWELLQIFGSRYVAHEATHGTDFYGIFGVVLATVAWIYLESLALLISAEINVVMHRRLWPRALLILFSDRVELTPADKKAYAMYAATQEFKGFEVVEPRFQHSPPPRPVPAQSAPAAPPHSRPESASPDRASG